MNCVVGETRDGNEPTTCLLVEESEERERDRERDRLSGDKTGEPGALQCTSGNLPKGMSTHQEQ